MKKSKLIFIIFLILSAALLYAEEKESSAAAKNNMEELLNQYVLAWEYKDYETMYEYLPADVIKNMKKEEFVEKMIRTSYFPVSHRIARMKIAGNSAKVWLDFYEKIDGDVRKETINLVNERGVWKINPLYLHSLEISEGERVRSGGEARTNIAPAGASGFGSKEVPSSILPGMDTNKVLEKMVEVGKSIKDMAADVSISMPTGGVEVTMAGSIIFKNPNKMRLDITAPVPIQIVTNGKMLWIYISAINSVYQNDVSGMQKGENLILGFGESRDELLQKYDANLIGQASVSGKPAYLLNFIAKNANENLKLEKVELYVDATSFIPVKTVAYSAGTKVEVTFMGVTINAGIEDSLFDFQVPPGASISSMPLLDFF